MGLWRWVIGQGVAHHDDTAGVRENVEEAKRVAKAAFRKLPDSVDRSSVLGALGRVGKWTLKKKIASRLDKVIDQVAERFPEIAMVTEEASTAETISFMVARQILTMCVMNMSCGSSSIPWNLSSLRRTSWKQGGYQRVGRRRDDHVASLPWI
jgi:hypothetical protein